MGTGQRGLHQILGQVLVAGQEVRRAQQRGASGAYERVELVSE
jgi:hypothetical protein